MWVNAAPQGQGLYQHKGRKKSQTQAIRRKPHGLGLGGWWWGGQSTLMEKAGRERAEPDLAGLFGARTSLTPQSQCP